MTDICPTCGQAIAVTQTLTDRELDVLSAWWHVRSVKTAAVVVGVGEQRAKNLLARIRQRANVATNLEAGMAYASALRSLDSVARRRAA